MEPPHEPNPNPSGSAPTPAELRARLVASLWKGGILTSTAVDRAMGLVPRHLFLPATPLEEAYADIAMPTHWDGPVAVSSASQPAIVAVMLQQLAIEPGMRVLEIGAGTGYNAALLAELVGTTGSVTTLDIDPDIVAEARAHLDSAGYSRVQGEVADGAGGWPDGAPYDRIMLTVGADDVSPAWADQLAEGGLLVLPLKVAGGQLSVAFRKRDGLLASESVTLCGFMRLRGAMAASGDTAILPDGRRLVGEDAAALVPTMTKLLGSRPRPRVGYRVTPDLVIRLGLHGARTFQLFPRAWDGRGRRARRGLYAEDPSGASLALFSNALPLLFLFGSDAAQRVIDETQSRLSAAILPPDQWRIVARPRDTANLPVPPGATRIARRRFIFDVWSTPAGA